MTLIASLIFAVAFAGSIAVIVLTIGNAMPRIVQVIEMEFAPVLKAERRITFGEIRGCVPQPAAEVITFPRKHIEPTGYRLAA